MTKTKHTPGPWTIEHHIGATFVRSETTSERVADVGRLTQSPQANARLIAASPEMYRVLKYALQSELERSALNKHNQVLLEELEKIMKAVTGEENL